MDVFSKVHTLQAFRENHDFPISYGYYTGFRSWHKASNLKGGQKFIASTSTSVKFELETYR